MLELPPPRIHTCDYWWQYVMYFQTNIERHFLSTMVQVYRQRNMHCCTSCHCRHECFGRFKVPLLAFLAHYGGLHCAGLHVLKPKYLHQLSGMMAQYLVWLRACHQLGWKPLCWSRPESARARMDEARQRIMLDSDEVIQVCDIVSFMYSLLHRHSSMLGRLDDDVVCL